MGPIPCCVHQIWIGDRRRRPEAWMGTWREHYVRTHPEWEYEEWDEKRIESLFRRARLPAVPGERSPRIEWRQMIDRLRELYYMEPTLHGRADIARLVILYMSGGVYVDADSVWLKGNLSRFAESAKTTGVFAAMEPGKEWLANGVIGAERGSGVMLSLLQHLASVDYSALRRKDGPYAVTGPLLLTRAMNSITVVPSVHFYPVPWVGVKDAEAHKKMALPDEAYMFQYGMTTNGLLAPEN